MISEPPEIDKRSFSDLVKILKDKAPHYTPEWPGYDDKDPGAALIKIFSYISGNVLDRLNQVPRKNFIAFLDMLGIKLLPAQPARVPVTFKLAKGTENGILIPKKTQAAAAKTEQHDELPFETEQNLLAIPGGIKKVISIDPAKDAIYLPPPDFLDEDSESLGQQTYKMVLSASSGANNFQLDHVTDLEEGDFIKITGRSAGEGSSVSGCSICGTADSQSESGKTEYAVISGISGTIITITDKLLYSHPPDTVVEKIMKFTVFEAGNMQEHSLYIGHKDLFNVKSRAKFILSVAHHKGKETGVTPLKVSWAYWGEAKGDEGEDWREFIAIDKTQGLSANGAIELIKTAEGEIKEKEINSIKSRWIRCRVKEPLPVGPSRKLPELNTITFVVKSSGDKLMPDQAFNNDISLDITQPFYPFGTEPRIFDNLCVASEEIFSKKGAKIKLDFDLEPRGILGTPAAIYSGQREYIKIFARGTYGRLVEVEIASSSDYSSDWTDHGLPPDTKIVSEAAPAAVTDNQGSTGNVYVFVTAENGHLVERFYNGSQWQWLDHGTPVDGVEVKSDPSAIYGDDTVGNIIISVFVTGSDGNMYEFYRDAGNMTGQWQSRRKHSASIQSSPYAVYAELTASYKIRIRIFAGGSDGRLYGLDCEAGDKSAGIWTDYGLPDGVNGVKVDSRPYAAVSTSGIKAYVKGSDGRLWEFNGLINSWNGLGLPPGAYVDSDPHGYFDDPVNLTGRHIFIRDSGNGLWERLDANWKNHKAPGHVMLKFSPFVLPPPMHSTTKYIFSASSRNSLAGRVIGLAESWNEYKDPDETSVNPVLTWEYWNKTGWVAIKGISDKTSNLLKSGEIKFDLPSDTDETEVAGQKSYWIRARIVGGDYGKETFALSRNSKTSELSGYAQQVISTKSTIRPPLVNSLTISYEVITEQYPEKCLAYNNLAYIDQTDTCIGKDKIFSPFAQLDEKNRTVYLGFGKSFSGGPVRIFFDASELSYTDEKKPKLEWTYSTDKKWGEMSYLDSTEGLIRADMLEFIVPSGFAGRSLFGSYLYWIKGSLAEGEYEASPCLGGIYPNTTWAIQAETIKDEILGSSDGEPSQTFSFLKTPVLEGEKIVVSEVLSDEEKKHLVDASGEDALYEVKDDSGEVKEVRVLWSEVQDFFDSTPKSRHYTLDRATGKVLFGDGLNGMIPPAGDDNIRAVSYQTGGGAQGNVKAEEIKSLKSSVAGVNKAVNHVAAGGGADTATVDQMLETGPAMISHRNRAVTAEDFEWLAKQSSRKVAKARCLPNTNNRITAGRERETETGWVTVIIVPDEKTPEPLPSLELKRKVRKYLEGHCANTLSYVRHVNVDGPFYMKINVSVDVFVVSIDVSSKVEREVRKKMNAFFHPLTGGPEGKGWEFGRDVSVSDIYALLEDIDGVDHVENLKIGAEGADGEDVLEIKRNFLVANGIHAVKIHAINGGS